MLVANCTSTDDSEQVAISALDESLARDLKIGAIFVVFIASCLGVVVPRIIKAIVPAETDLLSSTPWLCLKSVSAGVILSVAAIHLLPDAVATLQEAMPEMEYPLGYAMCVLGIMITLGSELLAVACMSIVDSKDQDGGAYGAQLIEPSNKVIADDEEPTSRVQHVEMVHHDHDSHTHEHVHEHVHASHIITETNSKTKLFLKLYVMECCIAIHSVIIGVALGSLSGNEITQIRALMAAFSFHQFFEGVSIGSAFCEISVSYPRLSYILLSLFAITVPIGIIIGMYAEKSITGEIVSGIFNAIAAGSLIYAALVEMITEDFSTVGKNNNVTKVLMFFSLCVGNVALAVIAMWA